MGLPGVLRRIGNGVIDWRALDMAPLDWFKASGRGAGIIDVAINAAANGSACNAPLNFKVTGREGNFQRRVKTSYPTVEIDQLKLEVTETGGAPHARLIEIRCY